jgi:hypothetical protein
LPVEGKTVTFEPRNGVEGVLVSTLHALPPLVDMTSAQEFQELIQQKKRYTRWCWNVRGNKEFSAFIIHPGFECQALDEAHRHRFVVEPSSWRVMVKRRIGTRSRTTTGETSSIG